MLSRKSQLSLFIVVGAILLIIAVFLIFNSQFELFQSSDTRLKNQVSGIVEQCIYEHADNGVFLLGFQGGHIEPDEVQTLDPNRHVDFGLKIPNWDSERDDIPTVAQMEAELEEYVEAETMSCVRSNLQSLSGFLDMDVADEIIVDAIINKENVQIEAELPIRFREQNSEELLTVENYFVELESLRLGDMYDLGVQIYNLEGSTYFMEDLILDQIYSASDYSSPDSMPGEGMFFSCTQRIWTVPQLKENLANLNNNNFKYLYFEGTYPIDDVFETNLDGENGPEEYRDYYYNHYFFELNDPKRSFTNYRVEVMMPSTEITGSEGILQSYPYRNFEVTPSSGDIVKPMELEVDAGFNIPIPCIQVYHHLYTLDYDLIVRITDYSDDGNQYMFQYPLRMQIDSNTPKEQAFSPIMGEGPTATNDLFCAEESRKYPLRIYASDSEGNGLSDVNISYRCINLKCELGQTEKPIFMGVTRQHAQPYLETDFPYCVGGRVIAEKEGYHKAELRVDTDETLLDQDQVIYRDIELIPLKEFEIDASSFLIVNREDKLGQRVLNEQDGSIFVSIENQAEDFESNAIWPNEGEMLDTVSFLDKEGVVYNVSVYYADSDYELRGLIQLENWQPQIHSGNEIRFVIPGSKDPIPPDEYMEFYEYMQAALDSGQYGVLFR